ncbi:gspD [Symbiodinium sp. CCMP2592]|nr:gspD [Symbiodinium sp. CCMP2592]
MIRLTALALVCCMTLSTGAVIAQDAGNEEPEIEPVMDWGVDRPTRQNNPPIIKRNDSSDRQDTRKEPTVSFGAFSEPIELTTLIEYVGSSLDINIIVKGAPTGEVTFHAPVEIPKSQLIELLDAMLEQYSFTISHEPTSDFWIVQPVADVRPNMGSERPSTQIIPTPNIKPSLMVPALSASLGSGLSAAPNAKSGPIQAIDELGVIIINAPPRDISRIKALIAQLIQIDDDQRYIRFELDHLAAPAALERAVGLVGGNSSGQNRVVQSQPGAQGTVGLSNASLSNMADRITIDPQGNALIFKGTEAEIARVEEVLEVIDVPNTLEPKNYFAGSSAAQIADIAKSRGLGEVIQITDDSNNPFAQGNIRLNNQNAFQNQTSNTSSGGPVMVVDTTRGNIVYYGTPAQQQQLADLMKELGTEDERVVIKEYVLNHSDAEIVAELMTAIITGQQQTGESDFLPGSSGRNNAVSEFRPAFGASGGSDVTAAFDPDIVAVIADPDNNQVVVRAPIKQQDDLAKLITRLDRRKPQVYLQAMIVSVSDTENFSLAFESQINAGQFGLNTGNTLSSLPDTSTFGDLRNVNPGLAGLTAAVIMTDQIPIIINASQTDTDVRILSTPQLLVNDNQEAEIVSLSEQPFQEISLSDGGNVSAFAGFAEAGTTLRVTPSISDGGYLRLEYYVELSNFTATQGQDGSPPPRDRNTVQGALSVPSDATIVIGGITVDNVRDTVVKVPLLGDIPLVGELFKNTSKINTQSKLYVFLTPRIMTDPNFLDLKLMSEGPYAEMELDPRVPDLESVSINASNKGRAKQETDDAFELERQSLPPQPEPDAFEPSLTPVLIDPNEDMD